MSTVIVPSRWALLGGFGGASLVLFLFAGAFFLVGRAKDVFILIRIMAFLVFGVLSVAAAICCVVSIIGLIWG